MYEYISGTVAAIGLNLAVIDCGGVGYACKTTVHTLAKIQVGKTAKLYAHLNVREDLMELYGFISDQERSCFLMLTSVSGVGPKAGLSILSSTSPEGLAAAIITGDERVLTAAPGIGKKIAQRVILELKDKLTKGQLFEYGEAYAGGGTTIIPQNKASEASAALAVLGYHPSEVSAALKGMDMGNLELQDIIKVALKGMAK
jgi:Holliday junction DNA helicase, RuvA subunit